MLLKLTKLVRLCDTQQYTNYIKHTKYKKMDYEKLIYNKQKMIYFILFLEFFENKNIELFQCLLVFLVYCVL